MSIKERIRALNLQSGGGAPDSPTRQSGHHRQLPCSSLQTPSPSLSVRVAAASSSDLSPSTTMSPLRSSPTTSEKAQLFKAAKVIRKSFETEAGSKFLDGSNYSCNSQPSSPNFRQNNADEDEGNNNLGFADEDELLIATTVLKSWRAKEKINDGPPPSYEEVSSRNTNEGAGNSMIGDDSVTPIVELHPEIPAANADFARGEPRNEVAGNRSLASRGESLMVENDAIEENGARPTDVVTSHAQSTSPLGKDMDKSRYESNPSQYSMSGGEPYRAYARRSRLRSPRGLGRTSLDTIFVDTMDGTQSVTSAQSALSQSSLSQISSLSTRATRFLKDKKDRRKEAAFLAVGGGGSGGGEEAMNSKFNEMAKDIVQNTLRGEAYMEQIVRNVGVDVSEIDESLSNQSSKDWKNGDNRGRPQTIDIRPSLQKVGDYISDLNRDVLYQDHYRAKDDERQIKPIYAARQRTKAKNKLRDYQSKEDQTKHNFDRTASLDESFCSELEAKDLFDTYSTGGRDLEKQSTYRRLHNTYSESNSEFTGFQHGVSKSFDTGCQVLESMNPLPLLESAFNALSAHSKTKGVFFSSASKNAFRSTPTDGDAPFDEVAPLPDEHIYETVAIEVEYVEHGEELQSVAETDSVFSVSTRDLESYT